MLAAADHRRTAGAPAAAPAAAAGCARPGRADRDRAGLAAGEREGRAMLYSGDASAGPDLRGSANRGCSGAQDRQARGAQDQRRHGACAAGWPAGDHGHQRQPAARRFDEGPSAQAPAATSAAVDTATSAARPPVRARRASSSTSRRRTTGAGDQYRPIGFIAGASRAGAQWRMQERSVGKRS